MRESQIPDLRSIIQSNYQKIKEKSKVQNQKNSTSDQNAGIQQEFKDTPSSKAEKYLNTENNPEALSSDDSLENSRLLSYFRNPYSNYQNQFDQPLYSQRSKTSWNSNRPPIVSKKKLKRKTQSKSKATGLTPWNRVTCSKEILGKTEILRTGDSSDFVYKEG